MNSRQMHNYLHAISRMPANEVRGLRISLPSFLQYPRLNVRVPRPLAGVYAEIGQVAP